jgi:hypothetical protein
MSDNDRWSGRDVPLVPRPARRSRRSVPIPADGTAAFFPASNRTAGANAGPKSRAPGNEFARGTSDAWKEHLGHSAGARAARRQALPVTGRIIPQLFVRFPGAVAPGTRSGGPDVSSPAGGAAARRRVHFFLLTLRHLPELSCRALIIARAGPGPRPPCPPRRDQGSGRPLVRRAETIEGLGRRPVPSIISF